MSRPERSLCVVKVGGSLFAQEQLAERLQTFLGEQPPGDYLLLAGGGELVDVLRRWHARHGWDEESSHWAAVRALDVNAWLLHRMLSGSRLLESAEEFFHWHQAPEAPRQQLACVVCAPWGWLCKGPWGRPLPELPASWNVTSDSIAAWVACKLQAQRLVLLKSAPPPSSPEEAVQAGYVDPHFTRVLAHRGNMAVEAVSLSGHAFGCVRW